MADPMTDAEKLSELREWADRELPNLDVYNVYREERATILALLERVERAERETPLPDSTIRQNYEQHVAAEGAAGAVTVLTMGAWIALRWDELTARVAELEKAQRGEILVGCGDGGEVRRAVRSDHSWYDGTPLYEFKPLPAPPPATAPPPCPYCMADVIEQGKRSAGEPCPSCRIHKAPKASATAKEE